MPRPIDANALSSILFKRMGEYETLANDLPKHSYEGCVYYGKVTALYEAQLAIDRIIPTLDYAPVVHGYWKHEEPVKDDGQKPFVCSTCGLRHPRYGDVDKAYFSYCPWCGTPMDAEMDEGESHEY